jgi:hypothetical protein
VESERFINNHNFESADMDKRLNLKTQWGDFKNALLNPYTVLTLIGTLILLWIQRRNASNAGFSTVLTLLTGLLIGFTISRFDRLYFNVQERRPMIRRGTLAIRRLGTLIENIHLMESRIVLLQEQLAADKKILPEVMQTNLGDLRNFCLSIQLACFSSIEDWTEILPYTSVSNLHAQVIAKFLHHRENAMEIVRALNEELSKLPDKSSDEVTQLKSRISIKEHEVSLLNELLFNSRTEGMWNTFTPEPVAMQKVDPDEKVVKSCRNCGENYITTVKDQNWWGWCPTCMSERKMPHL